MNPDENLQVAIIDDTIHTDTPHGRAIKRIVQGIEAYGIRVADVASPADARAAYSNLPAVNCILINWNLGGGTSRKQKETRDLIHEIRDRNEDIPIFLMAETTSETPVSLTVDMIREISEYIYVMEDTPEFIAGRITAAAKRYQERLLPPFFGELVRFSKDFEYSWHTPGHAGGRRSGSRPRDGCSMHSSGNSSSGPISPYRSGSSGPCSTTRDRSARQRNMQRRCSVPT